MAAIPGCSGATPGPSLCPKPTAKAPSPASHATTDADPTTVNSIVDGWKSEFQALDAIASANLARVAAAMQTSQNSILQNLLADAQHNLAYAESDESGGFHNHPYLMALLRDANQKALSIPLLNVTLQAGNIVISWSGSGTLQTAPSPNGPWSSLDGATNPLLLAPAAQSAQRFYRLGP